MPEEFDPEWEFWTPDEEIAEVLAMSGACRRPFDLLDAGRRETVNHGLRFGRGDPDAVRFRLAPPRRTAERPALEHQFCPTCEARFLPARRGQTYCSPRCVPHAGCERRLADAQCEGCGVTFRPYYDGQRFHSLECFNESQATPEPESGCRACGAEVPPSESNNGAARHYCSPRCKRVWMNRQLRKRKRGRNGR